nr:DUF6611 family protein [Nocardioides halotolerans]
MFPPGTDGPERRLLRTSQWWPSGGAIVAAVTAAVACGPAGAPAAAVLAAVVYAGPLAWLRHLSRRPRRDVRVVHAEHHHGPGAAEGLARCVRLVHLARRLTEAERALDAGELTPVDFQRVWGEVHEEARRLETEKVRPAGRR